MRFDFTPEQEALAERVRAFTAKRVAPFAAQADRDSCFPAHLLGELAGEELLGLGISPDHGGGGAGAVATGIVLEELARGDISACWPVLNAALVGGILEANGSSDQQKAWLPQIAAGESVVALCLTEQEHGTDAAAIELRAEPAGSGWRLSGEKASVNLGGYATHGLVFARTGEPGASGITAFFLRLDGPQVTVTPTGEDLGSRAGRRSRVRFDAAPAVEEEIVGGLGMAFRQVMRGFDYSRALIALMSVSAATASVEEALARARDRVVFGQPLGRFQGASFPLVEHLTLLHAARLLAYEALWRRDAGLEHRVEANMAKWWGPRAASDAAHQALLTFGQQAWSDELPLGRRLRDLIGNELADGTANATKLVLARQLLGREHAP